MSQQHIQTLCLIKSSDTLLGYFFKMQAIVSTVVNLMYVVMYF